MADELDLASTDERRWHLGRGALRRPRIIPHFAPTLPAHLLIPTAQDLLRRRDYLPRQHALSVQARPDAAPAAQHRVDRHPFPHAVGPVPSRSITGCNAAV